MARTKNRKKAIEQDELEEIEALEELEDLEDLEDEEEVEDEEDVEEDEDEEEEDEEEEDEEDEEEPEDEEEEDEEEEEAPRPTSRKKKAATKSIKTATRKQSREAEDGRVGTQEVADHFGIDSRQLRILLRRHDVPVNQDSGRYSWKSLKSPQVIKIGNLIKSGEHKRAQKEQLEKVRSRSKKTVAEKPAAKKTSKTSTRKSGTATKTRRRRQVEEDED